jgi:16S rRNA (adenine1518-N6/adenine1519-N6)-dimethyltransferase
MIPSDDNSGGLSDNIFTLIKNYNIHPSKRLGQNFLIDSNIASKIIKEAGDLTGRVVVEIGSGMGSLTRCLLKSSAETVYAVEYDRKCLAYLGDLKEVYSKKLEVVAEDALKLDEHRFAQDKKILLISNLPYNISAVLLLKWLKKIYLFDSIVLMFQKEVAERIIAKPNSKTYGIISVLAQYLCDVRVAFHVPPTAFFPAPKIESSIIAIKPKSDAEERLKLYDKLQFICKTLFNQRRKMIRTTLKKVTNNVGDMLCSLDLDECLRPENLTVEDFVRMAKYNNI